MLKVLLYGYATGVFSSRGIARKLEEDVAFRVLGAGNFPSHRTLCEFRRRHLEDFQELFVEVVRLARELGMASLGKVSVDGTKVRAKASKRKAMSYGRMREEERRLEAEIEGLLKRAGETDAEEDARFGECMRGDELPEELRRREDRLRAIRAAQERLKAAQRQADDARGRGPEWERNPKGGGRYKRAYGEPGEKAQSNFTDPDSSIMKTSAEGFQQCYNAQVAVDGDHQLIVATELTANASDQGAMMGLLDEVREKFGVQPEKVLADAGYCNERDLSELEARGIDGYMATGREGSDPGPASEPCDAPHGEEAGHLGGTQAVRATQMAVGSPPWLDQGSPGIPTIPCPGLGQGARGMGLGVPGVEPQASANPCGCVRESARPGDMANRTHRRPLVRLLEPSPGPCAPLHTPRSRHPCPSSCPIPSPICSPVLQKTSCGADS